MEGITIGQPARPFRLPSAQGGEVGLEDYRGRKHVIVWFTKGMGCPFCRSQMTQLSRSYADVQSLDGEVLEISVSPVRRARLYAEKFRLPFPYLCDPDYRVRQQWGIASRQHGIGHYVSTLVKGMTSTVPDNDFGTFSPPLDEMRRILNDDDMGFFIVDKQGVVRYATTGAYRSDGSGVALPSNEEVLRELRKLSA
ncbi:MAG: redoxin domain-containing protein [Candidatus Binatia bacterium]|jgi:peroxiredoxin